jgi:hypothetical protein
LLDTSNDLPEPSGERGTGWGTDIEPFGQNRPRPIRQPTEILDPSRESTPASSVPPQDPGATVRSRPSLQPTEIYDFGQSTAPVERAQNDESLDDATRIARMATGAAPADLRTPRVQVVYQGRTDVYELQFGMNWIGRPSKSVPPPSVPLPDPDRYISRQHARVFIEGSTCTITDTSDNGTQLNGKWLPKGQPCRLKDGDIITIEGRELTIRLA